MFKKNILTILVASIIVSSCGKNKEETTAAIVPKVNVKDLVSEKQPEILSYSGTIEADNTVTLGFSIPGRIISVNVQEGQHVATGQLLATIETTTYKNAFDIANAGLEQANDNYKRLNELYTKGSLPERDFIAIKVAVAQATANKNLAAKNLADTKLYAPFTGIITTKSTEKGASAAPGIPVFTIMKTDKVYATVAIAESEIAKFKIGTPAKVKIASINETFEGKISILNPSADLTTRTFEAKVLLNNQKGNLLPGMISDIKIETGSTVDAITIPADAIVRDADDITYAFVVENNHAIKKRVNLGNFKGEEVIVNDGLKTGDKVIISGQRKLKDGQTVSL